MILPYSALCNSWYNDILGAQRETGFISLEKNLWTEVSHLQVLCVLLTSVNIKTERFCMFSFQSETAASIFASITLKLNNNNKCLKLFLHYSFFFFLHQNFHTILSRL